jgi:hypothetical protein
MKYAKLVIISFVLVIIVGCADSNTTRDGELPAEENVLIVKTDTTTIFIEMINSDGTSRGYIKNDTLEITVDYTEEFKPIADQTILNISLDNENCESWRISNEKHKIYLDSNFAADYLTMDFMISSRSKQIGTTTKNRDGKSIDTVILDPFPVTRKIREVRRD